MNYLHSGNVFIDIEVTKSQAEVGGWIPERMGFALAVTFDYLDGYKYWYENDIPSLMIKLLSNETKTIIGFNILDFDFRVLSAYDRNSYDKLKHKCFDILNEIYRCVGFRISLNDLAFHTLGKSKISDGLIAIQDWKNGDYAKVADYCRNDVAITRELFYYGMENFKLFYTKNGILQEIDVKHWNPRKFEKIEYYSSILYQLYKIFDSHSGSTWRKLRSVNLISIVDYTVIEVNYNGEERDGIYCEYAGEMIVALNRNSVIDDEYPVVISKFMADTSDINIWFVHQQT